MGTTLHQLREWGFRNFGKEFDAAWKAKAFLTAAGTLAFFFPFSIFFVAGGFLPAGYSWMSTAMIVLGGVATLLSELRVETPRAALARFAVIAAVLFVVEFVGLRTGFPFGAYTYTGELGPLLAGVPLAIPIAWYSTVTNAWRIADHLARRVGRPGYGLTALLAGLLTLALDLALEPMAGFIQRYWLWASGAIPMQNYASWFVLSTCAAYVLARSSRRGEGNRDDEMFRSALFLFGFHYLLFLATIVVHGYLLTAMLSLGLAALPFLLAFRRVPGDQPEQARK